MARLQRGQEILPILILELDTLLGLDKVEHIGYNGHQHRLTLRAIVAHRAWLGVECYRGRMVVIAAALIGNVHATLLCGAVVVAVESVMRIAVLADVNVVEGGVYIGLMMVTFASERNDTTRCKYRDIQQKHRKCCK